MRFLVCWGSLAAPITGPGDVAHHVDHPANRPGRKGTKGPARAVRCTVPRVDPAEEHGEEVGEEDGPRPGDPDQAAEGPPVEPPPPRTGVLRDGTPLTIRPLLPSDREELALGYLELSEESKRRRFFSPPKRLSESLLDYLTQLDYDQRFAWVAHLRDDPEQRGLGVARWVRSRDDPTKADAAVTVADEWQGRGLGTQLLMALIDAATKRGITTFVADILWENDVLLDSLRQLGARVAPSEPGMARVEFDLPRSDTELAGSAVHRMLIEAAAAS